MRVVIAFAAFCAVLAPIRAAEIRFAPGDGVILNPANDRGMFDLVVHTVGVATAPGETFALHRLRIAVMKDGAPVIIKYVPGARMTAETAALARGPERIFLAAQLLATGGPAGFFGRPVEAAEGSVIAPSQYLLTTRHHFSVDFVPDEVRVTAEGSGRAAEASLPVRRYEGKIGYRMPVDGAWAMHSLPMLASHHRLNPSTEFAVDFFKTDGEGRNSVGDPLYASNALGYGAPVKAAAAGEVVFVIADEVQDRAALLPRPGEDRNAAGARIGAFNMQRYAKDFRRAAAGNIVTLRHMSNGVVEYTSYGHLKSGSVRVRAGERVAQGQVIGEVGDTGDSSAVHLHFQVNADVDAFTSKSLPAVFTDMGYTGASRDPARFVSNGR
jgi:murein DD-endopeptidase MepM/ murein hydrolase activator NlpD